MNAEPLPQKPLRLWPGIAAAASLLLFKFVVVPIVAFGSPPIPVLGGLVGAGVILVWWLLFSRAPWADRVGALVLMAVALFAASRVVHQSIGEPANGMLLPVLALPAVTIALVASAVAARRLPRTLRRVSMAAAIVLACGAFALLRIDGVWGGGDFAFHWRWTQTPEERLLARTTDEPAPLPSVVPPAVPSAPSPSETPAPAAAPAAPAREADWPGFRGPRRDGVVRGVQVATDWSTSPPVEIWRRPIGPGWSSFAVDGNLVYTQEQRGQDEVVSCYSLSSGQPVWRHRYAARFWESMGGAGPRGTPALHNRRVYTFGSTGILNALDARTGAVVWTRNAASDTKTKSPGWGFASSPLVVGDLVIVATAGTLGAFDLETGTPRWIGPKGRSDYSSPHLATIDGTAQVLLLDGAGATSVAPADGTVLWRHALTPGSRIIQPAFTADGDVLASNGEYGDGNGLRRITVTHGAAGWTSRERWTSTALKPNFNDLVVHQGHAYGFDGGILACVDLADGTRKWKGGRYGNGQLVLLPDQDLLLVTSEEGELALVKAAPDQFTELARFKAIEGKTWNHPVLVGDVLLVRNGEEMAAFRLAPAKPGTAPAKVAGSASQ